MNEHSKHTTNKLIQSLDLPMDIFLGMPNFSLFGNKELYISNHRGIIAFGEDEITILVKEYQVRIKGKELVLSNYTKEDITINGYIHSMEFV